MPYIEQELRFESKLATRVQVAAKRLFQGAIVTQHRILRAIDVAESATANISLNQVAALQQAKFPEPVRAAVE